MTPNETAVILRQFNEWRRGDEDIPQFDPRKIGEAIDAAVEMIERLEDSEQEKERLLGLAHDQNRELVRLREECRALRAKIEAMGRQEPVAWMCSDKALIQMGYKKFSDRCEGVWNIPAFAGIPGAKGEEK